MRQDRLVPTSSFPRADAPPFVPKGFPIETSPIQESQEGEQVLVAYSTRVQKFWTGYTDCNRSYKIDN